MNQESGKDFDLDQGAIRFTGRLYHPTIIRQSTILMGDYIVDEDHKVMEIK